MRGVLGFSIFVLSVLSGAANANGHEPKVTTVPLSRVFVAPNFDDNDRAQLVVSGKFPNSCYKVGPYRIDRDDRTQTIKLRQIAYVYRGLCFDVEFPFSRTIDLGILPVGNYSIVDAASGAALGRVVVGRAKSDASDELLYAPVSDVFPYSDKPGESMLFLAGTFPAKCLKLAKVEVSYHADVIDVLPIAELRSGNEADCRPEAVPFTYRLRLKDGLTGTYLIHLRSLDGQAVNKLAEFPLPHSSP